MIFCRRLVLDHKWLMALLCLAAMTMKMLVPQGYMIGGDSKSLTVEICTEQGVIEQTIAIPMKQGSGKHNADDTSAKSCAFGGFSHSALDTIDPFLLAFAIAFIMLAGLRSPVLPPASLKRWLRPPPIGPPLTA
jgi:hypothetical protein